MGKRLSKSWDLILLSSFSIILILIIYLFPDSFLRKVIGLPFILFFPGYSLITFLFPEKKDLDSIERVALSFGLSIAITPLIGLALNYTPFGIRLTPILLSLATFNITFSLLSIYRRSIARDPFIPRIDFSSLGWEEMSRLDRILTVILLIAIITSIAALIYIIVTPKQGEKFTEFYILGEKGKAADYPTKLRVGQNATIIIGIANHEYRTVNYTVEIWLVNAAYYNNTTLIHHMYFFDRFNVTLNHTNINIEGNWTPQWEKKYTFSISKAGKYKMWFLLFKDVAPPLPSKPERMKDFAGTEAEKRILDAIDGKILSLNLNIDVSKI
ncbi:putative membrane protein [Archaeoglobus sulfaticallidus PM70-1]|uniref:Putative membrane protein n=1 Tax=Archaeoglobus sulfaticallidus PM70-1 TaxID=387631 RepID=N0BK15_9EURY|nr:DUF1616 domain-containing protein [Archaeoglobus sulfaticallidus]AGK60470.1 putative membrane protein [Archaeoglobus sulfaticallidus PM70-1]